MQGSGRNVNNTTEQDNNYNNLKEIFEKELKKEINKWSWYILSHKNFTSKAYMNMEECIKEVKKLLEDNLSEPITEFKNIISMFENII